MKRILVLISLSLVLCSTLNAFQGGGGESTKTSTPKTKSASSKRSGASSETTSPSTKSVKKASAVTKKSATAILEIKVDTAQSEIFLTDQFGKNAIGGNIRITGDSLSPLRIGNLRSGNYTLIVRKAGYPDHQQSIDLDTAFRSVTINLQQPGSAGNTRVATNKPNKPILNVREGEAIFWQAIENSTDPKDFEDYISRSQRGEFAGNYKAVAELKISRLNKAKAAVAWGKISGPARNLTKYSSVGLFSEGLAPVCTGDSKAKKCGFIDTAGREVIPLKYSATHSFSEGRAGVCVREAISGKCGFIDTTGTEIVPLKYDAVYGFSDGLSRVSVDKPKAGYIQSLDGGSQFTFDKYFGFIDKSGREVIKVKYDQAYEFVNGIAQVCIEVPNRVPAATNKEAKCGLVDKAGREIAPIKFDRVFTQFSEGFAAVCNFETRKCGFIDISGNEIVPQRYSDTGQFSEGLAKVCSGEYPSEKCGFIDRNLREVIALPSPLKYSHINAFSEGLAKVCTGELWDKCGFINRTGNEVIPLKYAEPAMGSNGFSEGLAEVCIYTAGVAKCGYIDKTGQEKISLKYAHVNAFSDGLAIVCADTNGKRLCGFVDATGKEITPIKYTDFGPDSHRNSGRKYFMAGLIWIGTGENETRRIGFVDKTGKEIIPVKYEKVWCESFKNDGFLGVVLDGRKGFVDIYGNEYFDQ